MPGSRPSRAEGVFGVVLAGGAGRRLGGAKATAPLGGRALIEWPLAALRAVLGSEVVVVAKRDTVLPPGLTVWIEPDEPRHPATGLIHALSGQRGQTPLSMLACAADLPFVSAELLRALLADESAAPAVVPRAGGRLQPLLALYRPAALAALRGAPAGAPLTATVEAMAPAILDWPDAEPFFNVNDVEDLRRAEARAPRTAPVYSRPDAEASHQTAGPDAPRR
jgi:molybdopterin-guanine dinucleotide biosynthesis protein A